MSIEVLNLRFSYGSSDIISDCSFTIKPGKIYCLLGRNGSGKTTLLRLLNGQLSPDFGKIIIDEIDAKQVPRAKIARKIGFVPQEHSGVFAYSVLDMVVMGRTPHLKLFERPKTSDYAIAEKALEIVGMEHLKECCYMEISGGERQLVFLARAIAQEASYYVLDEPTSHLDFCNQHAVMEVLKLIIRKNGCSAIIAMHDPNLALSFADDIIMVKNGQVLQQGSVNEIMTADNLAELYGIKVKIADIDAGRKLVYT